MLSNQSLLTIVNNQDGLQGLYRVYTHVVRLIMSFDNVDNCLNKSDFKLKNKMCIPSLNWLHHNVLSSVSTCAQHNTNVVR